jgi:monoamine oxidase
MSIAIIGAGLAGLNAARLLGERGLEVEVFEASERVGGRARTTVHDGVAIELGPEFIHGEPEVMLELARQAKLPVETIQEVRFRRCADRIVSFDRPWGRLGKLLAAATEQPDHSVKDFLDHARLTADERYLVENFVEGYYAAPLDDIGALGVASDLDANGDDPTQQRLRGGYITLVDWLAARLASHGVKVHLGAHVDAIDWSHDRVQLDVTLHGVATSVLADRTIVTVSAGVLKRLPIRPALGEHTAALSKLVMGPVVKLVLCLREPVWDASARGKLAFIHTEHGPFPVFWARTTPAGQHLTAWAGGPRARALAHLEIDALTELAIEGFAHAIFLSPSRIEERLVDRHFHDYQADPLTLGAYSYTRVSGSHAAETLSRPLRDRLWIAGEATDAIYQGSVAGALASGRRVAEQILALDKPSRGLLRRVRAG